MTAIDLRSISLVITFIAFIAVAWWAFSPSRKKRFQEDAKLPFADDEPNQGSKTPNLAANDKDKEQNNA